MTCCCIWHLQALHAINRASHICGWRTLLVLRVPPRSVSLGRRAIERFWWRISQGVRPLLCNAPKTANGYVWMQMIAWLDHYRSFLGPLHRLASVVGLLPPSVVMAVVFAQTSAAKPATVQRTWGHPAGTCRRIVAGDAGQGNEASWG